MGLLFLDGGGIASVSDEDHERCAAFKWRLKKPGPRNAAMLWCRITVGRRRKVDLFLHRLVAARMDERLIDESFSAAPKNGDYLDCRRENIEIAIHARKSGRKPRRLTSHGLPDDILALIQRPSRRKNRPKKARRFPRQADAGDGRDRRAVGRNPAQ